MKNFIECLKLFNAKERFILLENVLEKPGLNFQLSSSFLLDVKTKLNLNIPPNPPFFAIDYHLNWLCAALTLSFDERYKNIDNLENFKIEKIVTKSSDSGKVHNFATVEGNQEDIDMVLCWEHEGKYKLILIEAKATTAWDIGQLQSKAERLGLMLGMDERPKGELINFNNLDVSFILISPSKPGEDTEFKKTLETNPEWLPKWMLNSENKIHWVELKITPNVIWMVTRCDGMAKPDEAGENWTIKKRWSKNTKK